LVISGPDCKKYSTLSFLLKIPKIGPPFDSARAQNMDSLNVTTNQGPADRALDKPWIGPEYQPGKSAMIILHWTYYGSTEECMEAFLDGLWHDASFGVVFDEPCARGSRSRREITQDLAVVNHVQYVMHDINDRPEYPQHYLESQVAFTEVPKKLRPKAVWLLGKTHWEPSAKKDNFCGSEKIVFDTLKIKPVCSYHPTAYGMGMTRVQRVDRLAKDWEEVQRQIDAG
jgi:hypothetical protein